MRAPITPTQAWAVLAEHYGWADGSKAELSVLPDHPEPRTMRWSRLEEDAIQAYGAACAAHARGMALEEVDDMLAKLQSAFFDTSLIRKAVKQMKAGK